jgi:hypothetical protein
MDKNSKTRLFGSFLYPLGGIKKVLSNLAAIRDIDNDKTFCLISSHHKHGW